MSKLLKKSDVMREGYEMGLKAACKVIDEALLGYGRVESGQATVEDMVAEMADDLINELEEVKKAARGDKRAVSNINTTWGSASEHYAALRGYVRKAFGVNWSR